MPEACRQRSCIHTATARPKRNGRGSGAALPHKDGIGFSVEDQK
jgi:hypothetical protein